MKNKKLILFSVVLILALFIIPLILQLALSLEAPPGLPSELAQNPEELLEQAKNKTETKWDYLGKEWQNIFLKNLYISKIDSFFTEVDEKFWIFRILFGMPYSFSATLFATAVLWIFLFIWIGGMISKSFGKTGYALSLGVTTILAQIGFLRIIVKALGWLVFTKKEWWWNVLMIIIIIGIFIILYFYSIKILEEKRKKGLEKKSEQAKKEIIAFEKARKEGFEIGGGYKII